MELKVVPRHEWCNLPHHEAEMLTSSPEKVILSLENNFDPCFTGEECVKRMQEIHHHYLKEKSAYNIPFNFMVGNDGSVYEGRGWLEKPLKCTEYPEKFSDNTIDIAILGSKAGEEINDAAMKMTTDFVKKNVENSLISEKYRISAFDGTKQLF